MTVPVRGFSLLRGRLGRAPALGRSTAPSVRAPGEPGSAFRGFRSSGVRTSREKRFHLPEYPDGRMKTAERSSTR
ncbi:bifunctional methylenetetrahydrofolate dehydrogenase/cyclohydrolase 2, mitochondrial isoform 6 [Homo sapiens]|uniref:bifunctional methylenetetrahydrofolate dehydrogenase/cyclohydrolase 2, mitochondrial isoform 6 n=2 Tax=Homininae TaxID=207598 RepID=UPI000A20F37A|nr:bifunctional methylenetetrahydrofolate dehydrogenase/cyclohydrolase 2, mitochondrial isoform 6 [Homo sapiens]XP_030866291.2 bifunctional methylenetetrahydrofolate dehydrogenase/cyclohydrolase 2, mitochondrial isoform X8 [Gorilla gorilla gorilla]|eukprot:NP_001338260.1 probable bifunctional methylenetetrahydrofolate dehydrogenase/cyclohydrolase 2 isoform 6 [Homo sapiens]